MGEWRLLAVLRLLARLLHRLGRDDRAGGVRRLVDVRLIDRERGVGEACALVSALDFGILGFSHLALPALTLGLLGSGWYSRMLRSSMIEVLHQDFIRTARAKGLGRTRVLLRHVLPNAVLPLIPMIGIDIGIFMGGLVVVESVFGWPGIGQLAWQAIQQVDIPVIVGVTTVSAVAIVGGNLIADLVLPWVDPRIDVKK